MEGNGRWLMSLRGGVTWRCGGVISRDGRDLVVEWWWWWKGMWQSGGDGIDGGAVICKSHE